MKKFGFPVIVICIAVSLIAGCDASAPSESSSPAESAAPTESIKHSGGITEEDVAYAGPMTDNILVGIANNDYAVFSRDFSDTMKAAITKEGFDKLVSFLDTKIGEYKSKAFGQAADVTQNGVIYTVVIYTAKYSDEPGDVLITVTFSAGEVQKKVEGLNFNSPKLREQ